MIAVTVTDPKGNFMKRLLRVDKIPFCFTDPSVDQIVNRGNVKFFFKFIANIAAADEKDLGYRGKRYILVVVVVDIVQDIHGQRMLWQWKRGL